MTLHINVMAPLVIGDTANLDSEASKTAWQKFDDDLKAAAALGVHAVSTDVWWGLIEPAEGSFNWAFYDRMVEHIVRHGLKWVPILSFHQCGGNVGDNEAHVPLPSWIWSKLAEMDGSDDIESVQFVSEQKNASSEYVSFWSTELALDNYIAVMKAFQQHYAGRAAHIAEVNVSLGPSGELRYPSYNSHDRGTDYPSRGALQCYSSRARRSFRQWVMEKYSTKSAIEAAWGWAITAETPIAPPSDAPGFYQRGQHHGQYGRDLHDWYQQSLLTHGRLMLSAAQDVFASAGAPFKGIDIGAKFPGIHWRIGKLQDGKLVLGDRLAELSAGLIRLTGNDWDSDELGHGYRPLVSLFNEVARKGSSRVVLHFTCLEMPDGDGAPEVKSLAHQLVLWVAAEATRLGIPLKGENALSWNLPHAKSWALMRSALAAPAGSGAYEGLTLLRLSDCLSNSTAKAELEATIKASRPASSAA